MTYRQYLALCAWKLVSISSLCGIGGSATVNYSIASIAQITFSGNPSTLSINSATAGIGLTPAANSSTTWALTTNATSQRVSAQLNSNLPSGITLKVNLTAPSGATSTGNIALTTSSANLVTGISNQVASGLEVTYTLSATVSAPTGSLSRTITYTLSS